MQVQITEKLSNVEGNYAYSVFAAEAGNTKATVSIVENSVNVALNYCGVIVDNAAHKVWRGPGRQFSSIDAAILHYRSGEVKAILECAKSEFAKEAK